MGTILDKIIAHKREELKLVKKLRPLEEIISSLKDNKYIQSSFSKIYDSLRSTTDSSRWHVNRLESLLEKSRFESNAFYKALSTKSGVNIIAEVKKGSPSKGIICEDFDHISIAKEYEFSGAKAISVLTDERFFFGKLEYLMDIRREVKIPLLRKDFIVDEYQIFEAKESGANAILLIAAILEPEEMVEFLRVTDSLGMDALVEVHNFEELNMVLKTHARIIGINNRNLKDFTVDLNTTLDLVNSIPKDKVIVSESGIHTRNDIAKLLSHGVNTFLIGEALVRDGGISKKMSDFLAPYNNI